MSEPRCWRSECRVTCYYPDVCSVTAPLHQAPDATRCQDPTCCDPDRRATERTRGVWTTCDECGANWWCISVGWDDLDDEERVFVCSGGCEDGFPEGYFGQEGDDE